MRIDYREDNNTFEIESTFVEAGIIRKLPNRRWHAKHLKWTAPAVLANIRVMTTWRDTPTIRFTEKAEIVIHNKQRDIAINRVKFPDDFKTKWPPMIKQKEALDYIAGLTKCALFMEMGTGKSKVSLDWVIYASSLKKVEALIILCPTSLKYNWEEQIMEHVDPGHSFIVRRHEAGKLVSRFPDTDSMKLFILGIEACADPKNDGFKFAMDMCKDYKTALIVDEAHFIKNSEAKRTRNIIKMGELTLLKIALTGTPITQGILDLYAIFEFIDPNIIGIGDFWSFKNRYCVFGGHENKQIVGYKNVEELMELIAPFTFCCRKEECLDIPDKTHTIRRVELVPEHLKLYTELKKNRVLEVKRELESVQDDTLVAKNVLTLYTFLQQLASGFYTRDSEAGKRETVRVIPLNKNHKIVEVKAIIDTLSDTEQVIIWAKYREEILMLQEALEGYRTSHFKTSSVTYMGTVPEKKRHDAKIAFQDGKVRYFIATQTTGGTGLTLVNSRYAIYFSNSFKCGDRLQSEDRQHRKGQKNKVTYFDVVAEKTMDITILNVLAQKKNVLDYVMNNLNSLDALLP